MRNHLLLVADSWYCSILSILNLSSALDTTDHALLLNRLKVNIGIASQCSSSYLTEKQFSSPAMCHCGIPQGSTLDHILSAIHVPPGWYHTESQHSIPFICRWNKTISSHQTTWPNLPPNPSQPLSRYTKTLLFAPSMSGPSITSMFHFPPKQKTQPQTFVLYWLTMY